MITLNDYLNNANLLSPCLAVGDSLKVLSQLPNDSIDCVITSLLTI